MRWAGRRHERIWPTPVRAASSRSARNCTGMDPERPARHAATAGSADFTSQQLEPMERSFRLAAEATGGVSSDHYLLAGASLELQFASPALRAELTPAFAHLAVDAADLPSLTVRLWDSETSQLPPPPHPEVSAQHPEGAFFHFHNPPLRGVYQPGLNSLSILDSGARTAWHWVASAQNQPYWEKASPIRQILFWWLESREFLQVHGGAVGTSDGGVLLVGKGGSGKSTVALAALGSPLLYAGDDYVAVTLDPSPRVASLYNSGKLEPQHVNGLLSHLLENVTNLDRLDDEKAVIYTHRHFPSHVTSGFPLRAVLVPRVRPESKTSRVVDVSKAEAFSALAPSTMVQLHTGGRATFAALGRLIERLPAYGLEIGSDVAAISETVGELLSGLSGA